MCIAVVVVVVVVVCPGGTPGCNEMMRTPSQKTRMEKTKSLPWKDLSELLKWLGCQNI